jgi:hypothetical protein
MHASARTAAGGFVSPEAACLVSAGELILRESSGSAGVSVSDGVSAGVSDSAGVSAGDSAGDGVSAILVVQYGDGGQKYGDRRWLDRNVVYVFGMPLTSPVLLLPPRALHQPHPGISQVKTTQHSDINCTACPPTLACLSYIY